MMKTLKDKCDAFLDAIPYELVNEFQQKYCHRNAYYFFAKNDPDEYIRSVFDFSQLHQENEYFQYLVKCYLGSLDAQKTFLSGKSDGDNAIAGATPHSLKSTGPRKKIEPKYSEQSELKPEPQKKTHGKLFGSVLVHTDEELRKSIGHKLFGVPRDHDRYTRLTTEEKRFILRYAGLSKKEREVFEEKCDRHYFPYHKIAIRLGVSESLVKKRAVSIDKQIRYMLDSLSS